MHPNFEREISPYDLAEVIVRHRMKVLIWGVVVAFVTAVAIFLWPRKYESEAKLFLRLGRESIALDPTATMGATIQVLESRENQLNSARDMLKSRALLDRIVEKFGAEKILKGAPGQEPSSGPNLASLLREAASNLIKTVNSAISMARVSPQQEAIEKLSKSIGVSLGKNSSVINVSCTAKNPKLAQEILHEFLDAYREQHLNANHTFGSFDFFQAQATEAKAGLTSAFEELRDAKNALNVISIPIEQQSVQGLITRIEERSLETNSSLDSSEASVQNLRAALESIPEKLTTQQTTGFANVAADSMQQEYFKLLISVNELQAKLGESHPLTKIAREGALKLQQIVDTQAPDRTQTTTGVNPSRQSLELDLRREETIASSLRAKRSKLEEQSLHLRERLRTLNQSEVKISQLERGVNIAEAKYRSYVERLEQARIGDALESNRISNVNIVQPPSLVEKPISPKPLTIFGLAIIAMVTGSLGLVFGSEYLSRGFGGNHESRSSRRLYDEYYDDLPHSIPVAGSALPPRGSQVPTKG